MRKPLIRFYFLLLLSLSFSETLLATHAFTTEIFYRWKPTMGSDSTYEFTVIFERNCSSGSVSAPPSINVSAKSISLSNANSFTLTRLPITGSGVPPLHPPGIFNCTQMIGLCIEEYYYRGDWTSPARANDWVFSVESCIRPLSPNNPANLVNGGCMWVECGLNNLDFPDSSAQNWSPIFHNNRPNHPGYTSDPIWNHMFKTLCQGNFHTLDGSAKEYQGDSVVYSFYHPQTANGDTLAFFNGFSFSNPFPHSSGPLTINPVTGTIPFVVGAPTQSALYMIGIEAKEYRNDTSGIAKMIGYVRRELMIHINAPATCRGDTAHIKNQTLLNWNTDSTLDVYFHNGIPSSPNSFVKCASLSPDGSEFYLVDSNQNPPNIIQVDTAYWTCHNNEVTNKITLKLSEAVPCGEFWIFLQVGTDLDVIESECGFHEPAGSFGKITTFSSMSAGLRPDTNVCIGDLFSIALSTSSGSWNYLWNTNDTVNAISVSDTGVYWVRVTDKTCMASDTIHITGSSVTPPVNLGADSMICPKVPFNRILNAGSGRMSYSWNTNDTTGNITINKSGTYAVTVVDSQLCLDHDSIVIFLDSTPAVILGSDRVLCTNDTFSEKLSAPLGYNSYLWNTGDTSRQIMVSTTGTYIITTNSNNNCITKDTIEVLYDTSKVSLGGDTVVCKEDSLNLILTAPGYKSYSWSTNETTSSIIVTDTGKYWVEVVNNFDCMSADTIHITSRDCYDGITRNSLKEKILVYPNPATDRVLIDSEFNLFQTEFSIFNASGKLIKKSVVNHNTHRLEINTENLDAGFYLLFLKRSNSTFFRKQLMIHN